MNICNIYGLLINIIIFHGSIESISPEIDSGNYILYFN